MLIECNYCKARVDAKIIGHRNETDPEERLYKITLLNAQLQRQSLAIQGRVEYALDKYRWGDPIRVWPDPKKYFDHNIPLMVQTL